MYKRPIELKTLDFQNDSTSRTNLPSPFDDSPKVFYGDIHRNIFPCNQCPKSFNQIDNLRRHQRTHSGVKPLKCRFCDKRFHRADGLKSHTHGKHQDKEGYQNAFYCEQCKRSFASHFDLNKHKTISHEKLNEKPDMSLIQPTPFRKASGNQIPEDEKRLLELLQVDQIIPPILQLPSKSTPTSPSPKQRTPTSQARPELIPIPLSFQPPPHGPPPPSNPDNNFPMRAQYLSSYNLQQSDILPPQSIFNILQLPPFPKESLKNLPERPPIDFPAWHPNAFRYE